MTIQRFNWTHPLQSLRQLAQVHSSERSSGIMLGFAPEPAAPNVFQQILCADLTKNGFTSICVDFDERPFSTGADAVRSIARAAGVAVGGRTPARILSDINSSGPVTIQHVTISIASSDSEDVTDALDGLKHALESRKTNVAIVARIADRGMNEARWFFQRAWPHISQCGGTIAIVLTERRGVEIGAPINEMFDLPTTYSAHELDTIEREFCEYLEARDNPPPVESRALIARTMLATMARMGGATPQNLYAVAPSLLNSNSAWSPRPDHASDPVASDRTLMALKNDALVERPIVAPAKRRERWSEDLIFTAARHSVIALPFMSLGGLTYLAIQSLSGLALLIIFAVIVFGVLPYGLYRLLKKAWP